jgi:hypothetical protein
MCVVGDWALVNALLNGQNFDLGVKAVAPKTHINKQYLMLKCDCGQI